MMQEKHHWQEWIEPWYLAYALTGVVVAGLVPVLIPLMVGKSGNAGQVGLVVAAVSLGGLTSPLWGGLADRLRLHRGLLAGGMLLASLGLAVFGFVNSPIPWVILAILVGLGTASAATVANLFVVEAHPQAEWDERIGWLQTFYGIGQVAGLLLAGVLTQIDFRTSLGVTAILSAAAAILGWFTTKTPQAQLGPAAVLVHPVKNTESALSSPQRLFHRPNWMGIKNIGTTLNSPFGVFLFVWLLAFAGPAAVFSQYPILMQKVYGVSPATSSVAFAIIAALGLTLYTPAGKWSEHQGPRRILRVSLGIRLLAFGGMFGLVFFGAGGSTGPLALLVFAFVVLAWSLMSVSGTAMAARLSTIGEGQGLGIFNALTAVAGMLGAVLGGWAAGVWGYSSVVVLALAGVALGLGISFLTGRKESRSI
jgi:DHA1 family tetracycline resistance protein-like MFS transporter